MSESEPSTTTARKVSKFVVKQTINAGVTKLTRNIMIGYTRFDEESIITKVVPRAVGMLVSEELKPTTDKLVDKTADFLIIQRIKYQDKKNKKNAKKDN